MDSHSRQTISIWVATAEVPEHSPLTENTQFATPAEYVKLFEIRATPLAGDLLAAAWLALFHPGHLTSVMKIIKPVAAPLVPYWSGSPYWLGPPGTTGGRTVKYSFVPRFKWTAPHTGPKSNSERLLSLNEALRTTMVAIPNMTTQRIIETLFLVTRSSSAVA